MSRTMHALAAAAALLLSVSVAAPASAAPPGNDVVAGATVVGSLPATYVQSTVDATTDATDAAMNSQCGAPATNGSVWYRVTDTTGSGLVVDVSASDFSAGVLIVAGDPTAGGSLVACGPGSSAVRGPAGQEYWVMLFSDTPGVTGGTLSVTFDVAPPAPTVALTVDPKAYAYKDGSMRLTGTYSCTNGDWSSGVEGMATQTVGRTKINGFFGTYGLQCDGATHPWEAFAVSDTGLFAGGKAASVTFAFACGALDCAQTDVTAKVQVVRSGK